MWKNTLLYSGLIWIVGLIVGDIILIPFLAGGAQELIGIAAAFSFVGSLLPLFLLIFVVKYLISADFDPQSKAMMLGVFVAIATIVPVMLLFGSSSVNVNLESLLFALPYVIGLWLGIFLGYQKFLKNSAPLPDMENLIEAFGENEK